MRWWWIGLPVCILFVALTQPASHTPAVLGFVQHQQQTFAASAKRLQQAVAALRADKPPTLRDAKAALKDCRVQYKQLSFFLEYFFSSEAYVFNAPPKYEIDEPYIEWEQPVGLQQLESLLYDKAAFRNKQAIAEEAQVIATSAEGIPGLLYRFNANDAQLLESTRLELIRVMALYITGYDAPQLKSGLAEATAALQAMDSVYVAFGSDSVHAAITRSLQYLQRAPFFDGFDRLTFISDYAIPLQQQMHAFAEREHLLLNTVAALNPNADNLFSRDAFAMKAFGNPDTAQVKLGRALFFNKALSGHNDRSCATCHQPEKFFTDGLVRNVSLQGGLLPRNTPTLLYSCFQYSQFWDGRVKSLEEQVVAVMHNPAEMNAVDDSVLHRLQVDSMTVITHALAAYLRTLAPFTSPFDAYLRGNKKAMTAQQQQGFNLFMGKAQCGTCHFAPVFNGLTPPLYNKTEFEVLGTPLKADLLHPMTDTDLGRQAFFKIDFYKGAFKTPTVRNAAKTAPYLHHGAFQSLEQVMDFYNKGGGVGIGLKTDNQTLAATPLQLTAAEQKAVIAFMQALTDAPSF